MMGGKKSSYPYLAVLLFIALFSLWGCPKKAEVTATPEAQQPAEPRQETAAAPAAAAEQAPAAGPEETMERSASAAESLKPVYFDFDRSFIRDDAKDVMKANAAWLKAHPNVKIRIEGNADERGTIEYNQALGQRRALSAKRYLVDLGIPGRRISIISYGKEKPVCSEGTEICWQENRRDDFIANE